MLRPAHYVLADDGRTPVVEPDLLKWAEWYQSAPERMIRKTNVGDVYDVSTVFLGLDHNFSEHGAPILFETLVFDARTGDALSGICHRYATWDEAVAGHEQSVRAFREWARTGTRPERLWETDA